MTSENQAQSKKKSNLLTGIIVIAIILGTICFGVSSFLSSDDKHAAVSFTGAVTNEKILDPSTIAIEVTVKNTTNKAMSPTCAIKSTSADGKYAGSAVLNGETVAPGSTKTFVKNVSISDEGASYVRNSSISCK